MEQKNMNEIIEEVTEKFKNHREIDFSKYTKKEIREIGKVIAKLVKSKPVKNVLESEELSAEEKLIILSNFPAAK